MVFTSRAGRLAHPQLASMDEYLPGKIRFADKWLRLRVAGAHESNSYFSRHARRETTGSNSCRSCPARADQCPVKRGEAVWNFPLSVKKGPKDWQSPGSDAQYECKIIIHSVRTL